MIATFAVLLTATGGAQAAVYTNTTAHYHFTAPDWTALNGSGGDVAYEGPTAGFSPPTLSATHRDDPNATNTEAYVLTVTTTAYTQFKAMLGGTDIQAPHSFTTSGGRPAGEFIVEYTIMTSTTRVRQVYFASDGWNMSYSLAMVASPADYANNTANWTTAINSFGVDNEPTPQTTTPPPSGGGFLPGFEVAATLAAVAVAGLVAVSSRSGRRQ